MWEPARVSRRFQRFSEIGVGGLPAVLCCRPFIPVLPVDAMDVQRQPGTKCYKFSVYGQNWQGVAVIFFSNYRCQ